MRSWDWTRNAPSTKVGEASKAECKLQTSEFTIESRLQIRVTPFAKAEEYEPPDAEHGGRPERRLNVSEDEEG